MICSSLCHLTLRCFLSVIQKQPGYNRGGGREVPGTVFSVCNAEAVMVSSEDREAPDSVFSLCDTEPVRLQPGGREVPSTVFSLCDTEVEGYIQEVGRHQVQCFLSVIQK